MARKPRPGLSMRKALVVGGLLTAAVLVPPFLSPFPLSILMLIVIFAILAMSLDLLMGYTGMESLGQAAFFGMAAYTIAILTTRYGVGWEIAIPAALLASIVLAAIGAALAVRMTGLFFLVMTLVFSQVMWGLSHRWGSMTGGYLGLHGIPRPTEALESPLAFYYVGLGVLTISGLLMYRLVRSPFGLTLRGIKDSELRMRTSGFNVWLHKYIVFVIAGAFAGVSGVLYTYSTQFISPTVLGVETSFEAMLMVIIGGAGTLSGPLIGAGIVTGLRNYLSVFFENWVIILGVLYIIAVFFAPQGVLGLLPRRWRAATGVGQEPSAFDEVRIRVESPPAPAEPTHPDMDQTTAVGYGRGAETLRLEGVGKTFDNVRAVHDVTLTAHSGTRKVILGPNGAGKTTLFNLITGVYKPSSGNIFLFGENVTATAPHARTGMGLGRTFQVTNLFPTLTVMNNVRLGVLGVKRKKFAMHVPVTWLDDVNERCRDLLEMAGLWDERDTEVANLSYGHQRQLELMVTLASDPQVLLLDEPAAGLSQAESRSMVELIKALDPGLTVLIIEHDMDVAFDIANEVTVMHQGEVLAEGSVEEIRANELVREVYFGEAYA
ncbi:MAG: branched-chain amino acid ABC transporter ATP-binding protein/permease [Actinomycetota bacterium]|nr:branched-chain amino acid ABC transporter ATP-binding protein/permease [Actinomycetota bacterium]